MHRALRLAWACGGLAAAIVVALAAPDAAAAPPGAAAAPGEQAVFAAAAREFGVPESLLLALSYSLTGFEIHAGQMSMAGGYGPLHLLDPPGERGDGRPPGTAMLHRAATLIGASDAAVRAGGTANIRAGAALLADAARRLGGGHLPSTVGGWYSAVAGYQGATDTVGARQFADDVYTALRSGASVTTADGQSVRLPAQPGVRADRSGLSALHLKVTAAVPVAECPASLDCRYVPAAYAQNTLGDPGDWGNYDIADRPRDLKISYVVIHDTEYPYDPTVALFQNSHAYVSAHYVIRSGDGQVTQMVRTKNIAWQAGNYDLNSHSIGIEHEGYAAQGATWYTEALYRSSARLVRYLAARFGIALDRAHIIGHDNVPGIAPGYVAGMHWDPGPFWDWSHYMSLLGAPLAADPGASGAIVTIAPRFAMNVLPVSGCGSDPPGPREPVSFLYLRTAPRASAPLLSDPALHPNGSPGTTAICDTGDKASTGQRFAVAERRAGWTAIWYAGQKGWLDDRGATLATQGSTVTVKPGRSFAPVYGRAYPEAAAYRGTPIIPQPVTPLQYRIRAGQRYVVAGLIRSNFYNTTTIHGTAPGDRVVVRGHDEYYLIYFNHRMAYVRTTDVSGTARPLRSGA